MVTAVVLINVSRSKLQEVVQALLGIEGVSEVYTVAGEYDLVAMVRVASNQALSKIVCDTLPHQVSGITHTKTLFALEAKSRHDLAKLFNL